MLKAFFKSLSVRVIGLFLLVHLVMLSVSLVAQYRLRVDMLVEHSHALSLAYYIADNSRQASIDLKPNQTDVVNPIAEFLLTDNTIKGVVENNPNFWMFVRGEKNDYQYSLGRKPLTLQSSLYTAVLSSNPTSVQCDEANISNIVEGYEVITLVFNCPEDGAYFAEIGGLRNDYVFDIKSAPQFFSQQDFNNFRVLLTTYALLMVLTPFLIFFLVRPIGRASRVARKITPYSSSKTLPTGGIFTEALGLVESINNALQRLRAGYERERWFRDVLAHELRTPLTILRARVEEVEDHSLRTELVADLKKTSTLIERLLAFSKTSQLSDNKTKLSLIDEVIIACAECGPLALNSDIELDLRYPENTSIYISANKTLVFVVLTNLINNAIKHSQTSKPISIEVLADGEIKIRDNGVGLDLDIYKDFFKNFSMGQVEQVRRHGLGLIIVAELMQYSGGEIQVFQDKGVGVAYSIKFPLELTAS